jgi:hypothetical protein
VSAEVVRRPGRWLSVLIWVLAAPSLVTLLAGAPLFIADHRWKFFGAGSLLSQAGVVGGKIMVVLMVVGSFLTGIAAFLVLILSGSQGVTPRRKIAGGCAVAIALAGYVVSLYVLKMA